MLSARVVFVVIYTTCSAVAQNGISAGSSPVSLSATVGSPIASVAVIGIGVPGIAPPDVKFRYTGVAVANTAQPMPPNFVVVFPSSGTTSTDPKNPTEILIGLNETVVKGML